MPYTGSVLTKIPLRLDAAQDSSVFGPVKMQDYMLVPLVSSSMTPAAQSVSVAASPNEKPAFRFFSLSGLAQNVIRKNLTLPPKRIRQTELFCLDPAAARCLSGLGLGSHITSGKCSRDQRDQSSWINKETYWDSAFGKSRSV